MGPREEEPDKMAVQEEEDDPYAILNVSQESMTEESLQKSYKHLSRAFHPDKQPQASDCEAAQQVFVEFKNAYDILMDPVLRQTYDEHGHRGVNYVRRSMNVPDADSGKPNVTKSSPGLYGQLWALHKVGHVREAQRVLAQAMEMYTHYETATTSHDNSSSHAMPMPILSASLDVRCNTTHSQFLGQGPEPISLPEMEKTTVSVSIASPPSNHHKWNYSMGGTNYVKNGEGHASGNASIGYTPVQGTDCTLEFDVGDSQSKVSLGTTRVLSSHSMVTTTVSTVPQKSSSQNRLLAFSVSTHRALWDNQARGTWAMGVGSDGGLHFGLLSLTSLFPDRPRVTLKLNAGIDKFPIKLQVQHNFNGYPDMEDPEQQHMHHNDDSEQHTGLISFGWGGGVGIQWKASWTRAVTSFSKFSMGISHSFTKGLVWLISWKQEEISLNIPITVSLATSPGYNFQMFYLTLLTSLIDMAMDDILTSVWTENKVRGDEQNELVRRHEERLLELDKVKLDAERQVELMRPAANAKRSTEESKDGLVIVKATYYLEGGNTHMDATVQLQFWVMNSRLQLPATSKSHMLGFYQLETKPSIHESSLNGNNTISTSWIEWVRGLLEFSESNNDTEKEDPTASTHKSSPKLSVRYTYRGNLYETTISDEAPLTLPSPHAMQLGESRTVT